MNEFNKKLDEEFASAYTKAGLMPSAKKLLSSEKPPPPKKSHFKDLFILLGAVFLIAFLVELNSKS